MNKFAAATLVFLAMAMLGSSAHAIERPPQFIAIAFDNCTELERWQELSDFAGELNKDGERIHFTFFVSGINYLANRAKPEPRAIPLSSITSVAPGKGAGWFSPPTVRIGTTQGNVELGVTGGLWTLSGSQRALQARDNFIAQLEASRSAQR